MVAESDLLTARFVLCRSSANTKCEELPIPENFGKKLKFSRFFSAVSVQNHIDIIESDYF